MSEQKESSVLFSLKELMNLEEDRIRTEEQHKAATAQAAEQARAAQERAAREAEEQRIRDEQERRRIEDVRGREEAARLEAIRHGEIEKARVEAEKQAQLAAMATQQQHERQLAAIKGDEQKKSLRNWLIGGGIFAVLVVGGIGAFAYNNHITAVKEQQRLAAEARTANEERDAAKRELATKEAAIKGLENDVANEKDEKKKALLQAQLAEAKKEAEGIQGKIRGGGPVGARPGGDTGGAAAPPKPCGCNKLDPLCDC